MLRWCTVRRHVSNLSLSMSAIWHYVLCSRLCLGQRSETSYIHIIADMSNPWEMFHTTWMTFYAIALWETTESSLGKLLEKCSSNTDTAKPIAFEADVSTHSLSPNILQQEACPLNSCVYFILVQYPLRRVNAPAGGPWPHPYDFTWPVIVSPLSPPLCVSETPPFTRVLNGESNPH